MASHRAAQKKLRASPKGPKPEDEVERVRAWRARNREAAQAKAGVLRDDIEPVLKALHSRGQMILGKGPGIVNRN